MVDQSAPSASSLMVKSYSLRATKSSAAQASMLSIGSTATLAPMKPILAVGLMARIIVAVLQSDLKLGVEVWMTMNSWDFTSSSMSLNDRLCGGASISLLPGTIAAACASQVGNQNDFTSRFIW